MLAKAEQLSLLLAQMPRAQEGDAEVVYVIQARDGGPVKIGHTSYAAVDARRRKLQTGNHQQLVVRGLFRGGMWLESALHEYLGASRLQGEWFSLSPELIALCPEVEIGG